jgi:hypothetical protein
MFGHRMGSTVVIRPELRFEHAYNMPAYNLGTKQSQLTFSMDVIFRY